MNARDILNYYSRDEVQAALLELAQSREVVGVFRNGSYDQRPNILAYPQDITALVRGGVIEFHSSLERWSNPMLLKQSNYSELRIGWDMVIDLDLDYKNLDHGKIIAAAFMEGLQKLGVKNFSLKFTGGTGFHILIPWEAFPEEVNYQKMVTQFPELPRIIGRYLAVSVQEKAEKEMFRKYSPEELAAQTNKPLGKILTTEGLNMRVFMGEYLPRHIRKDARSDVAGSDSVLLSPRHLFRMPYSLHRTTGLVSLPLEPAQLDEFSKEQARPERVRVRKFVKEPEPGEAELLVIQALDWAAKQKKEKVVPKQRVEFKKAVSEAFFPPCMKNIYTGLGDGRKRSLFILTNMLVAMKWKWEDIEAHIWKWNEKNTPPLGDTYVRAQLRWHKRRNIIPPNCTATGWYQDIGICAPDSTCGGQKRTVKNPVNYPRRLLRPQKARRRQA